MTHRQIAILLLLSAVAVGCSSDKSTGPSGSGPEGGPYEGTWAVSVSSVTGGGADCRVPSFNLVLHQFGDSVAGLYTTHGHAACLLGGDLYTGAPGVGQTGGHLAGDTIQFGFSLPLFSLHAHAHDSLLTGVLVWRVAFSPTQTSYTVLAGNWTAHRLTPPAGGGGPADSQLFTERPVLIGGDSGQLIDTVRGTDGQPVSGAALTFGTSDPATATVTPGGVLVSRAGTLRLFSVTAQTPGAYVDAVAVNIPGAAKLTVTPPSVSMERYEDEQLTVQVFDSAGEPINYVTPTFSVWPTGVVTLSSSGKVTSAGTIGTATITIKAGPATASVHVAVVAIPNSFVVTPGIGSTIAPHDTVQMTAAVTDSVGLPVPGTVVAYSTSDSTILTVSPAGLIRSVGPNGSADITASSGAFSSTRHFIVWGGYIPSVVATDHTGGQPFSAAVSGHGAIYVGDGTEGGLYRGDLPSYALGYVQPFDGLVRSIAFDSSGHRAFLPEFGSRYLDIMNVDSNRVVDSIDVDQAVGSGQGVVSAAVSPDGTRLFVGAGTFLVSYDAQSLVFQDSLGGGTSSVAHFSFHPTLPRGYASFVDGVEEFDQGTLQRLRVWSIPNAQGTAVSPDGSELYVALGDSGLRVIDLNSGAIGAFVATPGLYDLKILPGPDLIIAGGLNGNVYVIDRKTLQLIIKLPVGGAARRMALSPDGHTVVEANESGWVDFIQ